MVTGGMLTQVRNGVAEALSLVTPIIVRSKIFRLIIFALLKRGMHTCGQDGLWCLSNSQ